MKRLINLPIIVGIILFASCERKITDLEFEKNVMTEIFPSLIDSTCLDLRLYTNFPPEYGKAIYDKTGHYIGVDSTKATKEQKQKLLEWKINTEKIKNDTSKIIIAFDPKLKNNSQDLKEDFEKHFKNSKIFTPKEKIESEYLFEFKDIRLNNKFVLKNISEFPKERDAIWNTKYNFVFSGVVSFSRIQFDKNKQFGILDGGFVCGGLCGQGFRIYIKKVNNKWIIDQVEGTWIA
ncbi:MULTISPECIES: hypothetical protein [unclassified Flavobacterium]|uniref:hypothetical protein n=1 Tax=unclassified Flavobacterium TaxID=196869 RepID=UPI0004931BC7|nr:MULTISPECIES: hypothetical protein [unclassified Flavobacterium]MBF4493209.1 hypothetical protein [Flavobacterium sp. MR2016-29]